MSAKRSGGTSSCKPASSVVTTSGSTSNRADRNCPTLIITPPSRMASARKAAALRRSRSDRVRADQRRSPRRGSTNSHQTRLAMTPAKKATMWRYRFLSMVVGVNRGAGGAGGHGVGD